MRKTPTALPAVGRVSGAEKPAPLEIPSSGAALGELPATPVPLAALLSKFSPLGSTSSNAVTEQQSEVLDILHQVDLKYLAELDRRIVELQSVRAGLLLRTKTYREWAQIGSEYRSFADWRGAQTGTGSRAAIAELGVAQTLHDTPDAQDAVIEGRMTMEHVSALNTVAQRASRSGGTELDDSEKSALVQMATVRTADQFAKDANRWLDSRDPVRHDHSHAEIRSRRFLHVSHAPNGTHIKGFLDPIAGHTLRVALEAATAKPTIDDDRDFGQRNADALEALASLCLNTGELKTGALVKPHVSFMMSEETFKNAAKELKRRDAQAAWNTQQQATDQPQAVEPDSLPVQMAPATLEDGTAIPLTELTPLLCDAEMTRIVVSADNVPTNLGRTQRSYSREQRRAIIARDKSCRFNGCSLEARWADVHHIDWWERDNGPTSLENGVLCCRFHHGQIHRGVLKVVRDKFGLPQLIPTKAPTPEKPDRLQPSTSPHSLESGTPHQEFGHTSTPSSSPKKTPIAGSLFDGP